MFSGKQTTARKMADQLKNCINQRAHGFYSNRIPTAGSVWITDTITNVITPPRRNIVPDKKLKYKTTVETLKMIKSSRKETKLLEALFSVIKARLNGFSPFDSSGGGVLRLQQIDQM